MNSARLPRGLMATLTLGLVLAAGCSDESSGPNQPDPANEDFGGYTTSDELPAFGDDALLADLAEEVAVTDLLADDPETRRLAGDPAARTFAVTLRWGHLQRGGPGGVGGDPEGKTLDWTGSAHTTQGRMVLRHVFSFEAGDRVELPREDPATLAWTSHTGAGVDGLTFVIHVPAEVGGDLENEALVFETETFDLRLTLAQLADWQMTYDVDEEGNQLRVNAMESGAAVSARGWVLGRWNWDPSADLGSFVGQWVHPRTGIAGFVRGHYGPDDTGDRVVFYGKYINRRGDFEGFLRGGVQVREGDLVLGVGTFQGGWYDETGAPVGAIEGRWTAAPEQGGYFSGIWCSGCPAPGGVADDLDGEVGAGLVEVTGEL